MDNAEGSPTLLDLSPTQRSVLIGTLLGDGCLAKHGRFHRLHVKHKLAHLSLVEMKYTVFRDFVTMHLHHFDQILGDRRFPCVQFATRTHPLFSEWHNRFYQAGKKRCPIDLPDLLDPLAMAVWYMDDGSADHHGLTIQTHNFDFEEVTLMVRLLQERFDLTVNERKNKSRWLIYIGKQSVKRFVELIEPHVLPELRYKLVPRKAL